MTEYDVVVIGAGLWEPDAELVATGARPRHGREAIVAYYPKVLAG